MDDIKHLDTEDHAAAKNTKTVPSYSPEVEGLTHDLIGQIADKWTLIVYEELAEHGTLRFSALRKAVPGISQKMLTQTLRQMERIGIVSRKVYPVIPPRVEYSCTDLGLSLGPAICSLWTWVEQNAETMSAAQTRFDQIPPG
jgi:DNA-binding HxlR family transcriptional regulator